MGPYEVRPETAVSWKERCAAAAVLLGVFALAFLWVDQLNAASSGARIVNFALPIDAHVPFVPAFVYAYLLYYPWPLLLVPILRRREQLSRAVAAFVLLEALAVCVFMLFPSHMDRPVVTGTGLAPMLVRALYRVDAGWNLVPSLHVAHATLVAVFFYYLRPRAFPWVAAGSSLIALSTVLIKQHYVIDIPLGALAALFAYYATARAGALVPAYREQALR